MDSVANLPQLKSEMDYLTAFNRADVAVVLSTIRLRLTVAPGILLL